jgi:hypothetical protein
MEIIRLKKGSPKLSAGRIANQIRKNPTWATMENGQSLSAGAVRAVINRAKKEGLLPS